MVRLYGKIIEREKSAKLDMPEGVVKASFNVETGELATEVFDDSQTEYFSKDFLNSERELDNKDNELVHLNESYINQVSDLY